MLADWCGSACLVMISRQKTLGETISRALSRLSCSILLAWVVLLGCTVGPPPVSQRPDREQGLVMLQRGQYEQAVAAFDRVLEQTSRDAEALVNRGIAYDEWGKSEQAIASYTQALSIDPNLAAAYYNRGNSKNRLGDMEGAIADYSQAIEQQPQYAEAYANRGASHRSLGNVALAVADFERAQSIFVEQGKNAEAGQLRSQIEELQ